MREVEMSTRSVEEVAGCGLMVAGCWFQQPTTSHRLAALGECLVALMLLAGLEQWAGIQSEGWKSPPPPPIFVHFAGRTETGLETIFAGTRTKTAAMPVLNFADSSQRPQSPRDSNPQTPTQEKP
jgi:hypothetical protein